MNPVKQTLGGYTANLGQRLIDSRESGQGISGGIDVVKPNNRDILRHTQIRILKRTNGPDGRNVIEGNKRGERLLGCQQLLHHRVSKLRRRDIAIEADNQLWIDLDTESLSNCHQRIPALIGVRAEWLAVHKCNLSMPQRIQVSKSHFCRGHVIEYDVGHA